MHTDKQSLIADAVSLGKAGVDSLIAEMRAAHEAERDELAGPFLSTEHLDDTTAAFEERLAELEELRNAYDALPRLHEQLGRQMRADQVEMTVAIQLVQNGLRLRELYAEFRASAANLQPQ